MSRETEVAAYLRADGTLYALAEGGIYAASLLGTLGLTDPENAPDAWSDGVLLDTVLVREAAKVPTNQVVDLKEQVVSTSQRVEIYTYGRSATTLEAMHERIYTLMQGHAFDLAYPATWVGPELGIIPAQEFPSGTKLKRADYRIVSMRRPVVA